MSPKLGVTKPISNRRISGHGSMDVTLRSASTKQPLAIRTNHRLVRRSGELGISERGLSMLVEGIEVPGLHFGRRLIQHNPAVAYSDDAIRELDRQLHVMHGQHSGFVVFDDKF